MNTYAVGWKEANSKATSRRYELGSTYFDTVVELLDERRRKQELDEECEYMGRMTYPELYETV